MILTPEVTIVSRVDKGTFPSSSLPSNFVVPSDAGFGDTFDQRGSSELGSKKLNSTLCFCFITDLCSSSGRQSCMSLSMDLQTEMPGYKTQSRRTSFLMRPTYTSQPAR